ncbi:MAG: hypothetical protein FJ100_23565 [Deltaproteobacteria bacterium]|nr:hypothetical protein [Deltaproteobacteria bacterium]
MAQVHDDVQRAAGLEPALVTLTTRDTGDPATALRVLRAAWPTFRAALRTAGASMGSNGSWLRAEEYTDGVAGHLHWHIVCWMPPWVDYAALHRAWWHALALACDALGLPDLTTAYVCRELRPGGRWPVRVPHWRASGECGAGTTRDRDRCGDEPCGLHAPGNVDVQRRAAGQGTVEAAAGYCVKAAVAAGAMAYVLKGADLDGEQTVDEAERFAEYMDGRYGQRRFQGSISFWKGGRLAPGVPVLPDVRSEWSPVPALVPGTDWPERIRVAARWWESDSRLNERGSAGTVDWGGSDGRTKI